MSKKPLVTKRGEGETLSALGTQVTFLCPAESTERSFSLMEVRLPLDAGPPPHDHPWDEAYYVIEGEVRFLLGDRKLLVSAGDFLYAPAGMVHSFKGASADQPARVLVLDAPAAAEGFFRDVDREVRQLPQDLPKVPGIGLRHKLRFHL